MNSHAPVGSFIKFESTVDDLPDEVLEYILSLVAPYKDLQECALVCKRWHRSVKNVIRHAQKNLNRAISDFNIRWENITPAEMAPSITKRYSHSACRYENSMYVFGGCTSTSTTFNDLWRLDLNKRQWVRPLTMGTYPSPKACASIVCYKEALILFGGWTHPSPYPLHQAWRLFNELHVYGIVSNRWTCINTPTTPPAMAGHSATIQGEWMVVFGGLQKTNALLGQYGSSNDVWCFNLETQAWNKQATTDVKPHSRYGQSQISLDDKNILILGGCGGPNMVFSDVWLLSLTDPVWTWREVAVRNPQWAATHMWCHPACKIGQRVVIFSRSPVSTAPTFTYNAQWNTPSQLRISIANVWVPPREDDVVPADVVNRRALECLSEPRPVDRDLNVNGRRGTLSSRTLSAGNVPQPAVSTSSSSGEESDNEIPGPSCSRPSPEHRPHVNDHARVNQLNCPTKPLIASSFSDNENAGPSGLGMAAFRDPSPVLKPNASKNRQRQLESLRRMEERIRNLSKSGSGSGSGSSNGSSIPMQNVSAARSNPIASPNIMNTSPSPSPSKSQVIKNAMTMFVLDISHVLTDECYVEWLPIKPENISNGEPEEKILYTLVAGKGELIMFGGIQKDATSITSQAQLSSNVTNTVSNSLHFITAPRGII
ncbi:F-box only protein 42 [Periplaneta americana]|uniref:F-box only protein 42 n=1 Tax=Periplaneta americana TaxID=6978 RepID=UPI0037E89A91